ncbi:hypothetical protein QVD17_07063 [Tagetes erecta]|uniref:Uncharacterized protein n=1 Tax=Tagetes erecta TaxID=13708 RepID=A0AAD8LPN0_TARER|nr:hypothetical protein QVD17_07063 [Tagetes erecta]
MTNIFLATQADQVFYLHDRLKPVKEFNQRTIGRSSKSLSRDEGMEVNVSLEHVDVDGEAYEDTDGGEDNDADNAFDVIDELDDD